MACEQCSYILEITVSKEESPTGRSHIGFLCPGLEPIVKHPFRKKCLELCPNTSEQIILCSMAYTAQRRHHAKRTAIGRRHLG